MSMIHNSPQYSAWYMLIAYNLMHNKNAILVVPTASQQLKLLQDDTTIKMDLFEDINIKFLQLIFRISTNLKPHINIVGRLVTPRRLIYFFESQFINDYDLLGNFFSQHFYENPCWLRTHTHARKEYQALPKTWYLSKTDISCEEAQTIVRFVVLNRLRLRESLKYCVNSETVELSN